MAAFERAIEVGAEWVELDIHADADGRLVVTHDKPRANRAYPTLEEALDQMRGRIGVMAELKTPGRYRRHNVVARCAPCSTWASAYPSAAPARRGRWASASRA